MTAEDVEVHRRAPTREEWDKMATLAREALEEVLGEDGAGLEITLHQIYLMDTNQYGPDWIETWTMPNEDLDLFYKQKTVIAAARMSRQYFTLDEDEKRVVGEFGTRLKTADLLFSYTPNNPRGFHRQK